MAAKLLKEEIVMPKVGKTSYPYTAAGKKAAAKARNAKRSGTTCRKAGSSARQSPRKTAKTKVRSQY